MTRTKPLRVLSEDEISEIHSVSLQILSDIGIRLYDAEILGLLSDAGAEVDYKEKVAKIPSNLVESSAKKIPHEYTLDARNTKYNIKLGNGDTYFDFDGFLRHLIDTRNRTRREATERDLEDAVKLGNSLDNIHACGVPLVPQDVPLEVRDIHAMKILFEYGEKPYSGILVQNPQTAKIIIRMAATVSSGYEELRKKPLISYGAEPTSPLEWSANALGIMKEFCKHGLPIGFGPMVQSGATGPVTLAGTLALNNAEILSGVVIVQLLNPRTRINSWGALAYGMEFRKKPNISYGSPEDSLLRIAEIQIAKKYGAIVMAHSSTTGSKISDQQAGYEKMMMMLSSVLAGADLIGPMGLLGSDEGISFEQLVMDNEIAGLLSRIKRGILVTEETLALDVIKKVGIGGTFLTQKHTMKHLLSEHWPPELSDKFSWVNWEMEGKKSVIEKAEEKVKKVLSEYEPTPLGEEVKKELEKIVKEAERNLCKSP